MVVLSDPFTDFDTYIQTPFTDGMSATVSTAMGAIQAPLTTLVVLWIIVNGILVMRGDLDARKGIAKILNVVIVVGLLMSTSLYNEYIVTFFTAGLPNWIATALGAGSATTQASTFNQMWLQSQAIFIAADKGISVTDIVYGFELALLEILMVIPIAMLYIIYETSKILMDIVVCLGPFVLGGYLFDATRGVADRFIGKLIGLTILTLLIDIMLSIMVKGFDSYIASTSAFIQAGQSTGWFGTTENVAQSVFVCFQMVVFLALGSLITCFLPGIASYIGGGVSVNPMMMAAAAMKVSGMASGATAARPPTPK